MFNADQFPRDCLVTVYEMIEALKGMPVAQQAYLQGVLVGMKAVAPLVK